MMDHRGGGVWRRSLSKLTTNVKRQLSCSRSFAEYERHHQDGGALRMGISDPEHQLRYRAGQSSSVAPPQEQPPLLRNAISLDDRDDEPHYKLERVRLSLVGLSLSSQLIEIQDSNRSPSWDASEDARLIMGATGPRDHLIEHHHKNGSEGILEENESFDILEDYDELRSGRFSGVLEALRSKLLATLPCVTEDMLSRAIINEFASNDDEEDEQSNAPGKREGDNTEADHLLDLIHHQWLGTRDLSSPRHKQQRDRSGSHDYFEQCLCKILHQIRTGELQSAEQAYSIVLTLAAGLGRHNDSSLHNVILIQLPENVSRASLYDEFSVFGKVMALGVSRKQPLFAFCRFNSEQSVTRVLSSNPEETMLIRGRTGIRPKLQSLGKLRRLCNKNKRRQQQQPDSTIEVAQTTSQEVSSCSSNNCSTTKTTVTTIDTATFDDILDSSGTLARSPTCVSKFIEKSTIFR
jgi:RNA recognition motif. (a.k.a. RRM, RBD, or RNP domain)